MLNVTLCTTARRSTSKEMMRTHSVDFVVIFYSFLRYILYFEIASNAASKLELDKLIPKLLVGIAYAGDWTGLDYFTF